jgi:hypothetical protein
MLIITLYGKENEIDNGHTRVYPIFIIELTTKSELRELNEIIMFSLNKRLHKILYETDWCWNQTCVCVY